MSETTLVVCILVKKTAKIPRIILVVFGDGVSGIVAVKLRQTGRICMGNGTFHLD